MPRGVRGGRGWRCGRLGDEWWLVLSVDDRGWQECVWCVCVRAVCVCAVCLWKIVVVWGESVCARGVWGVVPVPV